MYTHHFKLTSFSQSRAPYTTRSYNPFRNLQWHVNMLWKCLAALEVRTKPNPKSSGLLVASLHLQSKNHLNHFLSQQSIHILPPRSLLQSTNFSRYQNITPRKFQDDDSTSKLSLFTRFLVTWKNTLVRATLKLATVCPLVQLFFVWWARWGWAAKLALDRHTPTGETSAIWVNQEFRVFFLFVFYCFLISIQFN